MFFSKCSSAFYQVQIKNIRLLSLICFSLSLLPCASTLGQTTSAQSPLQPKQPAINSLSTSYPQTPLNDNSNTEILTKFLFGSQQKYTKPRFAFSFNKRNTESLPPQEPESIHNFHQKQSSLPDSTRIANTNTQFFQSPSSIRPNNITPNAAQRRQRIKELDDFFANSPLTTLYNQERSSSALNERPNITEDHTPHQTFSSNQLSEASKIRQVNAEEKVSVNSSSQPLPSHQNASQSPQNISESNRRPIIPPTASQSIPQRPQALKLSSRSFISTEVVELPKPGTLDQSSPVASGASSKNSIEKNIQSSSLNKRKVVSDVEKTPANVSPRPTLRSKAQFIDPKDL